MLKRSSKDYIKRGKYNNKMNLYHYFALILFISILTSEIGNDNV